MVVSSSISSLNAWNYNKKVHKKLNEDIQKLTSGFRINKSADDASGLAISMKMKAQIKALDTTIQNCEDGISLLQTADGYLSEIHDMSNRIIELAMKSANGTFETAVGEDYGNACTDRKALQNEVNQLCEEIDRIANTANFNKNNLFDGTIIHNTEVVNYYKSVKK